MIDRKYGYCIVSICVDFAGFDATFTSVEMHHVLGCILSLAGYVLQFSSLSILASLRKNSGEYA